MVFDMAASILTTLTTAVTSLLQGVGVGIKDLFDDLFLNAAGDALSNLGIWVVVLFGIAIGLGAVAWVSTLIRGRQR